MKYKHELIVSKDFTICLLLRTNLISSSQFAYSNCLKIRIWVRRTGISANKITAATAAVALPIDGCINRFSC